MATTQPGTFSLLCRACLENACAIPSEDKFGNVDAIIIASRAVNHSCMVVCSLRFCKGKHDLPDSIYNISANVPHSVSHIFAYSSTFVERSLHTVSNLLHQM
jgi:hypothetical protein